MTAPRKTVVKEEKKTKKLPHTGTKGKLIKGMSGKLPRNILSHGAFTEGLRTLMKGYSGIYALYHGAQLYRVGLTTDLHWRLRSYTKGFHGDKWDSFVIFRIAKVGYLKDIETLILQLTRPDGNKVYGKVPTDADLNRLLRKILSEHESTTRVIKKALKK